MTKAPKQHHKHHKPGPRAGSGHRKRNHQRFITGPLIVSIHSRKSHRHSGHHHHHKHRTVILGQMAPEETDVKLGRNRPYARDEKPRLIIDRYLDVPAMPRPPARVDRASSVTAWPMYGNDYCGDCTCAAAGHVIQAWTACASTEATVPAEAVLNAYEAVSGYDPSTGAHDTGAAEQDVLGYWRKQGVGGHKIAGFAELSSLDNLSVVKQCLNVFGTVYLGINLPQSAMAQFQNGEPWTYEGDDNIIGGHAVPLQYFGHGEQNELGVVTWGQFQRMSRAFWWAYVEEAWVVFGPDWLTPGGKTVDGLDLDQLRADFATLTGEQAQF